MHRRTPAGDSSQSSMFFSPWRKRGSVLVVGLLLIGCLLIGGRSVEEEGAEESAETQLTESQVESAGESVAEQLAPVAKREGQSQEQLETREEAIVAVESMAPSSILKEEERKEPVQEKVAETGGEMNSVRAPLLAGGQGQSSGGNGGENSLSKEAGAVEGTTEIAVRSDDELLSQLEAEKEEASVENQSDGLGEKVGADQSESVALPEQEEGGEGELGGLLPVLDREGTAEIVGEVFGPDGEGLPGVVVSIPQIDQTARADQNGDFSFSGLPAGELKLKFNKLGYKVGERTVILKKDEVVKVSQSLEEQPVEFVDDEYELDEVEIVGEFVEEKVEREFAEIEVDLGNFEQGDLTSGLSSEDFEKNDVSDAGDAVGKIAGANIVGGKFAVVRGLADRYVNTTFNGGRVASSVPDRKAIELDLFPASVLQGLNLDKTYRSDLSGDFGGASIDIVTKTFPEEAFISFSAEASYVDGLPDEILTVAGADLDFLGDVSLSFDLQQVTTADGNGFVEPVNRSDLLAQGFSSQQVDAAAREVVGASEELFINSRSLFPEVSRTRQPVTYRVSLGDSFQPFEGLKYGLLFSAGQKSEDTFNETSRFRIPDQSEDLIEFTRTAEWDVFLSGGVRLNDQHEIGATYFRKHTGTLEVDQLSNIRRVESNEGFGDLTTTQLNQIEDVFGAPAELTGNAFVQGAISRDLTVFQLSGKHQLGERGPRLNWSYTDSDAEEFQETSAVQFGTLNFQSPEVLAIQNENLSEDFESLAEVLDFFTDGVDIPALASFSSNREAFEGFQTTVNSLTAGDLVLPNPNIPAEAFLVSIRNNLNTSLGSIDGTLDAIDTAAGRPTETTFSNRDLAAELPGFGFEILRGFQTVEESIQDSRVQVSVPYYFSDENEDRGFELSLGGSKTEAVRETRGLLGVLVLEQTSPDRENRVIGSVAPEDLVALGTALGSSNDVSQLDIDAFEGALADLLTGEFGVEGASIRDASTGPPGVDREGRIASNARGTSEVESYFFEGKLFYDDFFLKGGVRFESEERTGERLDPQPDPNGQDTSFSFSETEILPSLSVGKSFFDGRLTFLAAWSRTVARPTFFEFLPNISFDVSQNDFRLGNADLENTQITNFDFSAALRFGEESAFRLSLFHKDLVDPIIQRRLPGAADTITLINGDSGRITGAEFELDYRDFKPFSLNANATVIDALLRFPGGIDGSPSVETDFPFQPRFIANVNLGYENVEQDWGLNLIYNYTSSFNTLLPATDGNPTQRQDSLFSFDLVVRKTFDLESVGSLKLTAGISNLFANDRVEFFEGGNGNNAEALQNDAVSSSRRRTFFVGGSLEF